jgi:ribonuclease HI
MIFTNSDGGSRGNPGPGACAAIVRREGEILTKYSKFLGKFLTNNQAEYEGLIMALELASKITDGDIICVLDSELVVKQLMGEYKVKDKKLLPLFLKVQKLQENFKTIKYQHASRWDKFQRITDELLNDELNRMGYYKKDYRRK